MKKIVLLSILVLCGYGCSTPVNPNTLTQQKAKLVQQNNSKVMIHGKVEFPNNKSYTEKIDSQSDLLLQRHNGSFQTKKTETNFKVKATLDDITSLGTVSLINPVDNKTIATGLTDSTGSFNLNIEPLINFSGGQTLILEVSARLGGSGDSLMSVRTYVQWNDNTQSWNSITTPSLVINTTTTALAIIQDKKKDTITPGQTMNTINVYGPTTFINGIGAEAPAFIIKDVDKIVTKIITQGRDPYSLIKYENYSFKFDSSYDLRRLTQTRDCSRCILTDIDLSKIDLTNKNFNYADFSGKDLSGLNFNGSFFVNANLSDTKFSEPTTPHIITTILSNTDFTGANFTRTLIDGANVSNTNFERANFSEAILARLDLSNINFSNSVFSNILTNSVNFTGADFSYVNFKTNLDFQYETDLETSDFTDANLTGADFTDVYFYSMKFNGADLSYATLGNLRYLDATTKFFNAYMEYTDLSNFNFAGTNVSSNSVFKGANFSGALFFAKDFSNYDLSKADFSYANLEGANLKGATITDTVFGYSQVGNTIWTNDTVMDSDKVCNDESIGACY